MHASLFQKWPQAPEQAWNVNMARMYQEPGQVEQESILEALLQAAQHRVAAIPVVLNHQVPVLSRLRLEEEEAVAALLVDLSLHFDRSVEVPLYLQVSRELDSAVRFCIHIISRFYLTSICSKL